MGAFASSSADERPSSETTNDPAEEFLEMGNRDKNDVSIQTSAKRKEKKREKKRKEKAKNQLMEAIRNGDLEAVKLCVEEVSDINFLMKDVAGNERTPLILASVEGKTEIVGYFADSGAELDKANEMGWTAISHAASKGHVGLIEYLLAKGADKDKANNDGVSPLYIAAALGHLAVLKCLLKHGAEKRWR